jgi:hypothetical protein
MKQLAFATFVTVSLGFFSACNARRAVSTAPYAASASANGNAIDGAANRTQFPIAPSFASGKTDSRFAGFKLETVQWPVLACEQPNHKWTESAQLAYLDDDAVRLQFAAVSKPSADPGARFRRRLFRFPCRRPCERQAVYRTTKCAKLSGWRRDLTKYEAQLRMASGRARHC